MQRYSLGLRVFISTYLVIAQLLSVLQPPSVYAKPLIQSNSDVVTDGSAEATTESVTEESTSPVDTASELPEVPTELPTDTILQPVGTQSLKPFSLNLTADQIALSAAGTCELTLSVYRPADLYTEDLVVTVTLPEALIFTNDGSRTFTWQILANDTGIQFEQKLTVSVIGGDPASAASIATIQASAGGSTYTSVSANAELAIVGNATFAINAADASDPSEPVTTTQSTTGSILQNSDESITLLAGAGTVIEGTVFQFTPIFQANQLSQTEQIDQTPTVTETETITDVVIVEDPPLQTPKEAPTDTNEDVAGHSIYLPLIVDGSEDSESSSVAREESIYLPIIETDSETSKDADTSARLNSSTLPSDVPTSGKRNFSPRREGNLVTYQEWHFDAYQQEQRVAGFERPVTLILDLNWLKAQGVSGSSVILWTRETITDSWQMVPTEFDATHNRLVARLQHFSYFKTGSDQTAQWLPSTRAFDSDRFTGAASLSYPIEVPPGPGGLAPALSLSYSSNTVDDTYQSGPPTASTSQASTVGYGWSLGGISSIHRTQGADFNVSYALVLNGERYDIRGGQQNPSLDPTSFMQITYTVPGGTWVVTDTKGTRYTLTPQSSSYYPVQNSNHQLKTDGWYLAEIRDLLGNTVAFSYETELGKFHRDCGVGGDTRHLDYTRSVRPVMATWGYDLNNKQPVPGTEKMRVRLVYDNATIERDFYGEAYVVNEGRTDWTVNGWKYGLEFTTYGPEDEHCIQAQYTPKSLKEVVVEVKDRTNGNWHILNKEKLLNASYVPGRFLLLNAIEHYGETGASALYTYTFGYTDYGQATNNVRLISANNGYGGLVQYTYQDRPLDYCETGVNDAGCTYTNIRRPVASKTTSDGLGNSSVITFTYVHGALATLRNSANNFIGRDFLGYKETQMTVYEVNQGTTTPVRFEHLYFHQGYTPPQSPIQIDIRRGRMYKQEVWDKPTGQANRRLLSVKESFWNGYWLDNNVWQPTIQVGPRWLRLGHDREWVDNVGTARNYAYETSSQNGNQFGNVTKVTEHSHDEPSLDFATWSTRVVSGPTTLLRTTATEYFPNLANNIVSLPARTRIYSGSDANPANCVSEQRTLYTNTNNGNFAVPPPDTLVDETWQALALTGCSSTATFNLRDTNWTVMQMTYDAYGNLTFENNVGVASNGSQDQFTYTSYDDYYHLFPETAWRDNDQLFKETIGFYGVNAKENNVLIPLSDPRAYWGAMAEQCSVNDTCTRQTYDNFGRPTNKWNPLPKTPPGI